MKNKLFLLTTFVCGVFNLYSQSWVSGNYKLYVTPDSAKVGIGTHYPEHRLHIDNGAIKIGNSVDTEDRAKNLLYFGDDDYVKIGEWEADDVLSFGANKYSFTNGNVGIGVSNPQYKLDVAGKLFLHLVDAENGWGRCYLNWEAHKLVMGVPSGTYGHTLVEIKPGGSSEGELFSRLSLFHAYNENNIVERIRLDSHHNCWINNYANFGIGTDNPQYKLDVRGTIRANEIRVNTVSGADFVFSHNYGLRSLSEVKEFILEHQHLPEIPSANEMQQNGISINELQIQLLQKIEELTLYIIQQEERIKDLESRVIK